MLPHFIIIGTQRGGTTSLYNYLAQHPSIVALTRREVHYFDLNFQRGLAWYRSRFPSGWRNVFKLFGRREVISGESSPYYMFHPLVPQRIRQQLPQVRLIALLRNPVDRAFSHYKHVRGKNQETLPFEQAIACETERLAGEEEKMRRDPGYYSNAHHRHGYLSRGIYADQLTRWFDVFPREQMLILKSEELYRKPHELVRQTLSFLKPEWADDSTAGEYKRHNETSSEPLAPELRSRLAEFFRPHNIRLYQLLGRDFQWEQTSAT
jgi:hypothetical protein